MPGLCLEIVAGRGRGGGHRCIREERARGFKFLGFDFALPGSKLLFVARYASFQLAFRTFYSGLSPPLSQKKIPQSICTCQQNFAFFRDSLRLKLFFELVALILYSFPLSALAYKLWRKEFRWLYLSENWTWFGQAQER